MVLLFIAVAVVIAIHVDTEAAPADASAGNVGEDDVDPTSHVFANGAKLGHGKGSSGATGAHGPGSARPDSTNAVPAPCTLNLKP